MAKKVKDLCVVTRSYEVDGKKKNVYENVGHVLDMGDGSEMYLLKRSFNPAGIITDPMRDTIPLYRFEVKSDSPKASTAATSAPASGGNPEEDVPF